MPILVIFTTQEVYWIPSRKKKSIGFLKSKHNNYFIFTGPPGPQIIQLIPWHLFFYTPSILKCKTFFNTIKHLTFRHRGSKGVSLMQLRYQFSLTKSGQLHKYVKYGKRSTYIQIFASQLQPLISPRLLTMCTCSIFLYNKKF